LNWYDLFRKNYKNTLKATDNRYAEVEINGEKKVYKMGKTVQEYTPWLKHVQSDIVYGVTLSQYINKPEVRKAMNIDPTLGPF